MTAAAAPAAPHIIAMEINAFELCLLMVFPSLRLQRIQTNEDLLV
jgi:hypothetical protein